MRETDREWWEGTRNGRKRCVNVSYLQPSACIFLFFSFFAALEMLYQHQHVGI